MLCLLIYDLQNHDYTQRYFLCFVGDKRDHLTYYVRFLVGGEGVVTNSSILRKFPTVAYQSTTVTDDVSLNLGI